MRHPLWRFSDWRIHVYASSCVLQVSWAVVLVRFQFSEGFKIHTFRISLVSVAWKSICSCLQPIGLSENRIIMVSACWACKSIGSIKRMLWRTLKQLIHVSLCLYGLVQMPVSWSVHFMSRIVKVWPDRWTGFILWCLTIENLLLARHQPILYLNIQQILNRIRLEQRLLLIVDYQTVLDTTILNTGCAQRRIAPVASMTPLVAMLPGTIRLGPHALQGILRMPCFLGASLLAQLSSRTSLWCLFLNWGQRISHCLLIGILKVWLLLEWIRIICIRCHWACSNLFQMFLCKIYFVLL